MIATAVTEVSLARARAARTDYERTRIAYALDGGEAEAAAALTRSGGGTHLAWALATHFGPMQVDAALQPVVAGALDPAPTAPLPLEMVDRTGQVWRIRVIDRKGWSEVRTLRFTGAPDQPAAVIRESIALGQR